MTQIQDITVTLWNKETNMRYKVCNKVYINILVNIKYILRYKAAFMRNKVTILRHRFANVIWRENKLKLWDMTLHCDIRLQLQQNNVANILLNLLVCLKCYFLFVF